MEQEQWLQLKILFLLGYNFVGGEGGGGGKLNFHGGNRNLVREGGGAPIPPVGKTLFLGGSFSNRENVRAPIQFRRDSQTQFYQIQL